VGPSADMDGCGKSHPPPGLDPRNVQAVESRYTDWATPDHKLDVLPSETNYPIPVLGGRLDNSTLRKAAPAMEMSTGLELSALDVT
jgi:hypothetical protein